MGSVQERAGFVREAAGWVRTPKAFAEQGRVETAVPLGGGSWQVASRHADGLASEAKVGSWSEATWWFHDDRAAYLSAGDPTYARVASVWASMTAEQDGLSARLAVAERSLDGIARMAGENPSDIDVGLGSPDDGLDIPTHGVHGVKPD